MEFNEKLQALRKQKNMTQEELAGALFVSRTAISKWESGRGFPSIDSLKAIAQFFGISIDELLSGDELLTIAEEDQKSRSEQFRDLVFGLLDMCAALLLFLPFFGQRVAGSVQTVSLPGLTAPIYLKIAYYAVVISLTVFGIMLLVLQNWKNAIWVRVKGTISIILTSIGVLLFIISPQPYAAALLLVFLLLKVLLNKR